MSDRRPPPPRPLVSHPAVPDDAPAPLPGVPAQLGPVVLTIRAEVTIPATPGYAKRLGNLIDDLKRGVIEQAPWLRNVTVEVDRS